MFQIRASILSISLTLVALGACISEPPLTATEADELAVTSEVIDEVIDEEIDDIPLARLGFCRGYVTGMASRSEPIEIADKLTFDGMYKCTRRCPYHASSAPACRPGLHPKNDPCPDDFVVGGSVVMFIKADDAAAALAKCEQIWTTEYPKGCMESPEILAHQIPEYDEFECVED